MPQNIIEQSVEDELMLYALDEDSLHVLNSTARRIYEWIQQGDDRAAIVRRLCEQYSDMSPDQLNADVVHYLEELKVKSLLSGQQI
ncbi:MAG: PqqD family protein [Deltaproteobacteria bacterium]